jgi:hypothetical protein
MGKLTNLEKFSLFTGVVGLVADTITLVGLTSGLVVPPPQLGFWSRPEVVAVWTLALLVYGLVICLFFTVLYARRRWDRLGQWPDTISRRRATLTLGYLLWLPLSIIWGITILHLLKGTYGLPIDDASASVLPVLGWLYFIFLVPAGGLIITHTAVILCDFFNPPICKL